VVARWAGRERYKVKALAAQKFRRAAQEGRRQGNEQRAEQETKEAGYIGAAEVESEHMRGRQEKVIVDGQDGVRLEGWDES